MTYLAFWNSEPNPLIDSSTPLHARVLKTAQDVAYGLVFSDEFTQNGRSFSAGTLFGTLLYN